MIPTDIDTDHYDAASHTFGADIGPELMQATMRLNSGLAGTDAMAGNDQAGLTWAHSYDPAARRAAKTLGDATRASYSMAHLLQQTGLNHARAEAASARTGDIVDTAIYQDVTCDVATAPSVVGGSTAQPHGWSLIASHINGLLWPNGHQDRLQAAAEAWDAAARTLEQAVPLTALAARAVAQQRGPEIDDAVRVCESTGAHLTSLAATCRGLAESCRGYAGHLDKAHSEVRQTLIELLAASAATQAIGLAASFFSFGAAEAPTQAAEAGEIAVAATAVETTLGTLATEAVSVAAVADDAAVGVTEAATGLEQLAGADAVVSGAEESVVLPTVESSAERSAVSNLEKSAAKAKTPAKTKTPTKNERLKSNYKMGKAAERRVPGAQNSRRIGVGKGKFRVPDRLTRNPNVLGEVKNVKYQHYSTQLRDYVKWAKENDYRVELWVRDDTNLSGPLQDAIRAKDIKLKFIP